MEGSEGSDSSGAVCGAWAPAVTRTLHASWPSGLAMYPAFQVCHPPVHPWRQGLRVAAERTTTPASKSRILTAISRLDRKRIRVMLSSRNAKGPLKTSNINNAID